ncbi:TPA: hypothetical protein QCY21_001451 [Bacillus anthracis]|nr:hypothetical protein [Bacillus anthracis]
MKFNEGELVIIGFGIGTIILSLLRLAGMFQSSIAIAGFSIAGGLFVVGDFTKYFSQYAEQKKKTRLAKFLHVCFVIFYILSPVVALIGFNFSLVSFAIKDHTLANNMSDFWSRIGDFSTMLSMGLIFTLLVAKNKIIHRLDGGISLENSTIKAQGDITINVNK